LGRPPTLTQAPRYSVLYYVQPSLRLTDYGGDGALVCGSVGVRESPEGVARAPSGVLPAVPLQLPDDLHLRSLTGSTGLWSHEAAIHIYPVFQEFWQFNIGWLPPQPRPFPSLNGERTTGPRHQRRQHAVPPPLSRKRLPPAMWPRRTLGRYDPGSYRF